MAEVKKPSSVVNWGKEAFPSGEEPYPEDHKYHQMTVAPAPESNAKGPLGGLWSPEETASGPFTRGSALGLALRLCAYGLLLVAAPMAGQGVSPNHPEVAHVYVPLLAWFFIYLGSRWTRSAETTWTAQNFEEKARQWALGQRLLNSFTLMTVTLWFALGFLGSLSLLHWVRWVVGAFALANIVQLALFYGQKAASELWSAPWLAAHLIAQALLLGTSILWPLALSLGIDLAELTLMTRLFSLGLMGHALFCQRLVKAPLQQSSQLRVGRLCIAYRWVLWVGMLLPMTFLGLSLSTEVVKVPAQLIAMVLALPMLITWLWLWFRAGQSKSPPSGDPDLTISL